MSVQKCIIDKVTGNFTTFLNNVLQNLHNLPALGLYVYLGSLPHKWEFQKDHLRKHFSIGIEKLNKLLKVLEVHGLVQMVQKRDENGQFSHFSMQVNDGSFFEFNDLEKYGSPLTEKPCTVNRETVLVDYKRNIDKLNKNKKEILISCSSDDELKSFEQFWLLYPRKQKKKDAQRIWLKNKLHDKISDIEPHLMKRLEGQWKETDLKYIPLPSTFLNGERWQDDISNITYSNSHSSKPKSGREVSREYFRKQGINL